MSQGESCLLVQSRIYTLLKLEEERCKDKEHFFVHQNYSKCWFEGKSVGEKCFDVGDLVLKWYKPHEDKGKHKKFHPLWIGPFVVDENIYNNSFKSKYLYWRIDPLPINTQGLKHYFQ